MQAHQTYIHKEENQPMRKLYPQGKDIGGARKAFKANQTKIRNKKCPKARARVAKKMETSTVDEPCEVGCFLFCWADILHLRFIFAARMLVYLCMLACVMGLVAGVEAFSAMVCLLARIASKILFGS